MSRRARFVFDFDEPAEGGRELLGGKGIGLAEMTSLGLPVPAGFTITTDACRAYMAGGWPDALSGEVKRARARLEPSATPVAARLAPDAGAEISGRVPIAPPTQTTPAPRAADD